MLTVVLLHERIRRNWSTLQRFIIKELMAGGGVGDHAAAREGGRGGLQANGSQLRRGSARLPPHTPTLRPSRVGTHTHPSTRPPASYPSTCKISSFTSAYSRILHRLSLVQYPLPWPGAQPQVHWPVCFQSVLPKSFLHQLSCAPGDVSYHAAQFFLAKRWWK